MVWSRPPRILVLGPLGRGSLAGQGQPLPDCPRLIYNYLKIFKTPPRCYLVSHNNPLLFVLLPLQTCLCFFFLRCEGITSPVIVLKNFTVWRSSCKPRLHTLPRLVKRVRDPGPGCPTPILFFPFPSVWAKTTFPVISWAWDQGLGLVIVYLYLRLYLGDPSLMWGDVPLGSPPFEESVHWHLFPNSVRPLKPKI